MSTKDPASDARTGENLTLTSRAFRNDQLPLFYKELSELTGYEMSLPMNSKAEAVETAIKLARKWAYQVKGVPRYQAEIITRRIIFMGGQCLLSLFLLSHSTGMTLVLSHRLCGSAMVMQMPC
jgi:acetylornithine/succinyldiaminopimelate/putrescine aminotransferase